MHVTQELEEDKKIDGEWINILMHKFGFKLGRELCYEIREHD